MFLLDFIFPISLILIGLITFIYNKGHNIIMLIISLELLLLAIALLYVFASFILDDIIGLNMSLYLLILAGGESAIALAILIAYYPYRGTISI